MTKGLSRAIPMCGLVAALAVSNGAYAADTDGNYALRGVGSAACSDYTAALNGQGGAQVEVYVAWLAGYITARSRMEPETFDVLPLVAGGDVAGLMNVICTQNPDATFESAADAAIRLFEPARVQRDSPLLELAHEGRIVLVRQVTFEQVQEALAAAGLYDGEIDGAYGLGSRSALIAFQEAQGLLVTGLPDADTLVALLLADD